MSPFDLERFVRAQESTYTSALSELRAGRKHGHFMWFVFPQLRGLGASALALRYAIESLDEAAAYLAHPLLGARLGECTTTLLNLHRRTLPEILGNIDALKFRSSMTLFSRVANGPSSFRHALDKYCGGVLDPLTLELLGKSRRHRHD